MKQLSIALLAALSVTATAYAESSVTVYGRIDVGVGASHVDNGLGSTVNNVEMISGGGTSNRIGIKGTEDLGNGYKVKFVLENGFDSDTGAEGSEGLAFSREATLQIESPYGILAAGRSSVLGTDGGSFNLLGNVNPFGTGIWEIGNQNIVYAKLPASRNDNAVIYRSPVMNGFQLTTQYSMGEEDHENRSTSDHYFGLGVTWKGSQAEGVVLFERVNEKLTTLKRNPKDMWRVTAGGNWKLQSFTTYLSLQYFRNADAVGTPAFGDMKDHGIGKISAAQLKIIDGLKGGSVILGFSTPVLGGNLLGAAGYVHADTDQYASKLKVDSGFVGLGYQYAFSKNTKLYSAIGASGAKYKSSNESIKPKAFYGTLGLSHYF